MKFYAGIGSRETPEDILILMSKFARYWAEKGWTLRSGHAEGADMAFESASYYAEGNAEIYLPWARFNEHESYYLARLTKPAEWTFEIAEKYHPSWNFLKWSGKQFHARNVHQILGPSLFSPRSRFVCCWTKNGKGGGGTGQAIRIAKGYKIPVYDLGDPEIKKGFECGWSMHVGS